MVSFCTRNDFRHVSQLKMLNMLFSVTLVHGDALIGMLWTCTGCVNKRKHKSHTCKYIHTVITVILKYSQKYTMDKSKHTQDNVPKYVYWPKSWPKKAVCTGIKLSQGYSHNLGFPWGLPFCNLPIVQLSWILFNLLALCPDLNLLMCH